MIRIYEARSKGMQYYMKRVIIGHALSNEKPNKMGMP